MGDSPLGADEARHRLYEIMKQDLPFEEKAAQALSLGERYLGVDNGHVARIDPESEYWKSIASTDSPDGRFPPGLQLDLQTTYCRQTVTADDPVALHDAPDQGWAEDPAFEEHGIHCYHGTTITLDDEIYGTVCFVSTEPRDRPFSDDETMFAELIARTLEHELQRERTAARIERLDRFASAVSHDLRNPLNVAQARVALERDVRDSEHLSIAATALDRMEALISDVLAMARQGRDVDETQTVSLASVVEDCWRSVHTDDATVTIDGDLRFEADPDRIRQLFENLFRNSVEHGSTGGRSEADDAGRASAPEPSVADAPDDAVSISVGPLEGGDGFYVEDDGPGIPASQRDQVFDAGYSTGESGIGLGLSIVKEIVTAHDWTITVGESASGGTRFEISDVVVAQDSQDDLR